ncbi:LacI family DNA-binding transcriptional regulator [Paramicrobacterium chengjingii]|uniref:LacI family DNA-binding transcriptional regulator n=1 Tax=Paramicrobacterium chengjingii TaxID=2769067 RepID=A0ABX6YL71_9MICO|nr:LacI family DNA-binding transcriptional regulator [Microbacterium chengjingii]QPZ39090.1 LacI family DNA-binding transcriptional regulator [Microbacterium chengjingii]
MESSTPVTLNDVADEAGVSLATASRVLNGSARKVAESYRQRVMAAAAHLGYAPNLSAQAMAKGRANIVGLLVGEIADPYFSAITSGAMAAADEAGLVVTVAVTGRDADRELTTVRALRGQRPRAIILAGSRFSDATRDAELTAELEAFRSSGGRVVFISQNALPFSTVQLGNDEAAHALGERLATLGYRTAAVIAGPETLITSTDRVTGFTRGFRAGGGDVVRTARGDFTRDGGFDAGEQLAASDLTGIDLIFAASDIMAVGAMSALRQAGITPGADLGVAGFDDISTARDVTPPLTTVAIPLENIGHSAVELALRDEPGADPTPVMGTVLVRESTPTRAIAE